MSLSLKQQFPFRLIIGREDCTFLLDNGCTFSNADPGGFEAASFAIPKDMPQTLRGQQVRLDSGLQVAFEGRVSSVQRSLGAKTAIQCEGYQALFKDQAESMVFVDRDLTRWGDPSYQRQLTLVGPDPPVAGESFQLGSSQVAADPSTNLPALVQTISDSWDSPYEPVCELWYDAGPDNMIAQIFTVLSGTANVIAQSGSWQQAAFLSSDAVATENVSSGNLNAGGAVRFQPGTTARFAILQHRYNATPAGQDNNTYSAYWENLAVYGNHGIPGRGSAPGGFYPSDIFTWVLGQVPGLQGGTIPSTDASGYIVPHSVYYDPVTLDTMVADMATAAGWHWGVWASLSPLTGDSRPRADFRPRPAPGAFTAWCMRSDCEDLDITEDLAGQYNACVLAFTNVDGTDGSVTVTTDNSILDAAGIPTKVLPLSAGTMVPADAALYAQEALALTNQQGRVSGSATIISAISGGTQAPWMLQAGIDRLRIPDLPSTDAFGSMNDLPISRVECTLSTSGFSTSVEFGSGAQLVETLQARLQTAATLAEQG